MTMDSIRPKSRYCTGQSSRCKKIPVRERANVGRKYIIDTFQLSFLLKTFIHDCLNLNALLGQAFHQIDKNSLGTTPTFGQHYLSNPHHSHHHSNNES